jgi:thioester reductase-like protein
MKHYFLTGATGLLGSYLLRDAMSKDRQLTLLVRPSKRKSGQERVEEILTGWEERLDRSLPRPHVLEGELSDPKLGLDSTDREWIKKHCDGVIHNAASLSFFAKSPDGEPWLTNIQGVQNVLNLSKEASLTDFHHVSTAYVAGTRRGPALEEDLDKGQDFGNDYEKSKVEAEKLVRTASHIERLTVYRPSIIVGDSLTGHTSTYHGFYVLLRLAHVLVTKVVPGGVSTDQICAMLNVQRGSRKNFVCVDWVSAVMTDILGNESLHGRTYHLTSPDGTDVYKMADAIHDAVFKWSSPLDPSEGETMNNDWVAGMLEQEIEVYKKYLEDDPIFDCANTQAAAPDRLCPVVDYDALMQLSEVAIRNEFR